MKSEKWMNCRPGNNSDTFDVWWSWGTECVRRALGSHAHCAFSCAFRISESRELKTTRLKTPCTQDSGNRLHTPRSFERAEQRKEAWPHSCCCSPLASDVMKKPAPEFGFVAAAGGPDSSCPHIFTSRWPMAASWPKHRRSGSALRS